MQDDAVSLQQRVDKAVAAVASALQNTQDTVSGLEAATAAAKASAEQQASAHATLVHRDFTAQTGWQSHSNEGPLKDTEFQPSFTCY